MNTLKTLKMLPLIGALAAGMALAPAVSIAGDNDRGRGKDRVYQKHDGGKGHHHKGARSHNKDRHKYHRGYGHHKGLASDVSRIVKHRGHKHVYNSHYKHGHKHHGHRHPHHGHKHTDYVIVHDHYRDYDPFRLMLGLHFDNIDIIYRDF
jgi:hypothetical protein